MTDIPARSDCRVCGSTALTQVLDLGVQAVSDFVPADRVHAGVRCPLVFDLCRECTLLQARYTAPQDFLYTRHYWYRSGVTQTMRTALQDVVWSALQRVDLKPGDVVLDIGANDGTLLRQYDELRDDLRGKLVKVGVEPAKNLADECRQHCDLLIEDFWCESQYAAGIGYGTDPSKAKIITACGMFYDAPDPNPFIADVAKVLHPNGVFVAQLMCLKQTLEKKDVGNFAHEHLEFYSLKSLDVLFGRHGLEIFDVEENDVNGGSYRLFARHRGSAIGDVTCDKCFGTRENPDDDNNPCSWCQGTGHLPDEEALARNRKAVDTEDRMALADPDTYAEFARDLGLNRSRVRDFLAHLKAAGKRVMALGASTKGNVILQWLGADGTVIEAASDRSPEKVGRFTIGTGIPIISEEEARAANPDFFLVLPYAFLPELMEREREWRDRGGRFVVPIPEFRVV